MENKVKLKKGHKVFFVTGFNILEGIFISRGDQWNHIEVEGGTVLGYKDSIVFPDKVAALEYLVDDLKKNIYYPMKQLIEKLKITSLEFKNISELIKTVKKTNKILKDNAKKD